MEYNTCQYCGANNGRAGMLISSPSSGVDKSACQNCFDTLINKEVTIHTNLSRTEEEINKTLNLLNDNTRDKTEGSGG